MRIERLRLTGFRGANETEIKFREGLTLLRETDGGRSVLDAVLIAAGAFLRQMPFCDGCTFRHIDGEGAGLDAVFADQDDSRMEISRRAFIASDGRLKTTTRDAAALRELAMKCRRLQYDKSAVLPLVAFNGARRRWGWRCGVGETNWMRMDRLSVFSDACHPDVGVGMFAQWFVDLWYSMNDQRLKKMKGSILLDPPRLALYEALHKAVCDAVGGCLRTAEVEGLEYDLDARALLVRHNGQRTESAELPRDEVAVLGTVADLACRCCILNQAQADRALAATPGIVLLDWTGVRARWLPETLAAMRRVFPRLQFIVAIADGMAELCQVAETAD